MKCNQRLTCYIWMPQHVRLMKESVCSETVLLRQSNGGHRDLDCQGLCCCKNAACQSHNSREKHADVQVLTTLGSLATGPFQKEIGDRSGVSQSSVSHALPWSSKLSSVYHPWYIKFPYTAVQQVQIKRLLCHGWTAKQNRSNKPHTYTHQSTRAVVERTIGVLKARWMCLDTARGKLLYSPEKACQIILTCCDSLIQLQVAT